MNNGSGSNPTTNKPPISSFKVAATGAANEPLMFDASLSSDPDGNALTYSWEFGDDLRGGSKNIAHAYALGGTFSVKLTVGDGKGGSDSSQKTVTISAPPAPAKTVSVTAVIKDSSRQPLADVNLEVVGANKTASTDAQGQASLTGIGAGNNSSVTIKLSKSGFAEQYKVLELPAVAESGYFEAELMPREAAQTLPDAAAGGNITGKEGAKVTLPTNALVDSSGNAVTGAVQVALSPVDVTKDIGGFPGQFEGAAGNGKTGLILSYGTVEYALSQGGEKLNLAPGKQASIEIPVYATLNKDGSSLKIGDRFPLWSLNEQTGGWTQEGMGTVVTSSASPSGMALRGQVTHFSWWNHDAFDGPPLPQPATDEDLAAGNPYKPKPKCMIDTNADGVPEDLSGTGYCQYETSTDPNYRPNPAGLHQSRASSDSLPAWGASATLPASGGQILIMPPNMDIVVNVTALNGTLFGTKTFRGTGNIEEEVIVILEPLASGGSCATPTAISEPHLETYSFSSNGQTQCFNLTAPAGFYEVQVSQAPGSNLAGALKTTQPDNSSNTAGFSSQPGKLIVTHAASGVSKIEVKAISNTPGGYKLEVKKIANTGTPIKFDTDTDVLGVANKVDLFNFVANQGQQISLGYATQQGKSFVRGVSLKQPNNPNTFVGFNGIYTLNSGLHTIVVTNYASSSGTYRLRLNTVQAPVPLVTLDPLTQITTTLQLGEVRRYVFTPELSLGEVLAFQMESATNTFAQAFVRGFNTGNIHKAAINLGSTTVPQSQFSAVSFIPRNEQRWLYLSDSASPNENIIERLGGQFTLGIFRPSAQPMTADSSVTGSINPNTLQTYRVNIPTNGSYLLRGTIAAGNTVTAEIWNSDVSRVVNNLYSVFEGEFDFPVKFGTEEIKGGLKAGNHTITIHNRKFNNATPNTPTNYSVSLVTLENPTDIVIGAAAVNGIIDVAGERDYYRFNATVGQAFTITATSAAFAGTIRIHKLSASKDFTTFETFNIFGANGSKALGTHTFTIGAETWAGTGTYIIEIDATGAQTGAYSIALTSP